MYIIISASPNTNGLTAACAAAAMTGITKAGKTAEHIDISAEKLEPCRICGNGWGDCREKSECIINDILPALRKKISEADGVFIVTPVYWEQPSERMKYFLDRFRRCEAFKGENGAVAGKRVALVAAAGGSGNGTSPALVELEYWCKHVRAFPQDRIGVTRFNRETALSAIENAAERMASDS